MTTAPSLDFHDAAGLTVLGDAGASEEGLSVVFTTRVGGSSEGAFESLNLSTAVGDDPARVEANRSVVAGAVGLDVAALKLARQVHGTEVIECSTGFAGGEADALIAREPGIAVGVLTADCVPVLIRGRDGVAAVHAGWRGIAAGVVEAALERLGDAESAWVGPAIHACCYEVGPDVVSAFEAKALAIADGWHVDPALAAATLLRRAGIAHVAASPLCTSCDPRFFSYRRDGRTGRQGAFIALL